MLLQHNPAHLGAPTPMVTHASHACCPPSRAGRPAWPRPVCAAGHHCRVPRAHGKARQVRRCALRGLLLLAVPQPLLPWFASAAAESGRLLRAGAHSNLVPAAPSCCLQTPAATPCLLRCLAAGVRINTSSAGHLLLAQVQAGLGVCD